jgi:hypothetical protein
VNKSEGKWFAYVTGLKGPVPVIYHDGIPASEEKNVLVKWPIDNAYPSINLAECKAAFPFPVQQMEKPASQVENSGAS